MTESIRLKDLAAWLGREIEGDATVALCGVASLEEASEGDLAFVRSERFAEAARQVRGQANGHQVDGARVAMGHAYGGGSQFFAMWIVGSEKP